MLRRRFSVEFRDLEFGKADARKEAATQPHLLLEGFYDPFDLPTRLLAGSTTVLLGSKGSGKSAVVEHLELRSRTSSDTFVTRYDLYEFPYRDFVRLEAGGETVEARLPTAWNWVLLLAAMASFNTDIASASRSGSDFSQAVRTLTDLGFLPDLKIRQVVVESTSASIGAALRPLTGHLGRTRQKRGLAIPTATETLKRIILDFRSRSLHLIVLDGLDKQFVSGKVPWEELAALILAADKLNLECSESDSPVRFVVLIRPDMYDRLPSAETTKVRRDSGFHLHWYPSSERPQDSELFKLFTRKAAVGAPDVSDLVENYFPKAIRPRGGNRDISVHEYLLARTRHTPRDLGQLFTSIREQARREGRTGMLPASTIIDGATAYARDYFYSDVSGTLRGLGFAQSEIDSFMSLIKSMQGDFFSRRALLDKARDWNIDLDFDVDELLRQLYESGAIANKNRSGRVNFLFRQSTGELDVGGSLVMHRAFALSLNKQPLWVNQLG